MGPGVFTQIPPKNFLPKMGRTLRGKAHEMSFLDFTSNLFFFFFFTLMKCPSMHNFLKRYDILLFVLFNRDVIVNLYKLYF